MIRTFIFRLNIIHRLSGRVIFIHILRFLSRRQDEPQSFHTKWHSSISSGSCWRKKQPGWGLVERHPFTCLPLLLPPLPAPLVQILEKQKIPSRGNTDTLQVAVTQRHQSCCSLPSPTIHSLPSFGCSQKCFLWLAFFSIYSFFLPFAGRKRG